MNIIKYPDNYGATCPFCGESREWLQRVKDSFANGEVLGNIVDYGGVRLVTTSRPIGDNTKQIDQYKCYTCGAEWETEPYLSEGFEDKVVAI